MKNQGTLQIVLFICLVIMTGCGGTPSPDAKSDSIQMGAAAWFPDGNRFIFQANIDGQNGLYIYDLSTNKTQKLALQVPGSPFSPSISPDGLKIAFAVSIANESLRSDIYIANIDGTDPVCLVNSPAAHRGPTFSPDCRYLVFVEARSFRNYSPIARPHQHDLDLFAINLETKHIWQLTNKNFYTLSNPAINPQTGNIVVGYTVNGADGLACMQWAGDNEPLMGLKPLHPNLSQYMGVPRVKNPEQFNWSNLFYPSFDENGDLYFVWSGYYQGYFGHEIYRWTSDTDQSYRLTDLRDLLASPRPSPDGKYIVFLNSKKRLSIIPSSGGFIREVPVP